MLSTCMCVCVRARARARARVCVYIHIYTHTYVAYTCHIALLYLERIIQHLEKLKQFSNIGRYNATVSREQLVDMTINVRETFNIHAESGVPERNGYLNFMRMSSCIFMFVSTVRIVLYRSGRRRGASIFVRCYWQFAEQCEQRWWRQ